MPIDHYENFPVASLLLPRQLRQPVSVIYRFARSADDIADEGCATADERLAALRAYELQLERITTGLEPIAVPEHDLFVALKIVLERYSLPIQPFRDLLSAFSQDATTVRYPHFEALLGYCSRSANPVGRIMLGLYRADNVQYRQWSDAICTALQLVNFWQDVGIDLQKGRIYLPQDDLHRFGVDESSLASGVASQGWRDLMSFECGRTRALMLSGAPLVRALPGRIGLELRFVVQGGLRILEKIEAARFDVFNHRPVLARSDWLVVAARAFTM